MGLAEAHVTFCRSSSLGSNTRDTTKEYVFCFIIISPLSRLNVVFSDSKALNIKQWRIIHCPFYSRNRIKFFQIIVFTLKCDSQVFAEKFVKAIRSL